MAKIKESCACGATVEIEMVGWYAEINVQRAVKDWREAHKVCREREEQNQESRPE